MKEKLLEELKALETKYDDQMSAQRDELAKAMLGESGGEGETQVKALQDQLTETTRNKQELDKKVCFNLWT